MKKTEITCTACRNQCRIQIEYEEDEVTEVTGNGCMRGMARAQEAVNKLFGEKHRSSSV